MIGFVKGKGLDRIGLRYAGPFGRPRTRRFEAGRCCGLPCPRDGRGCGALLRPRFHKLLPLDGRKTDHRLSRVAAHAHARGIHNGQQHVFTAFVILRMPDTGETAFVALGAYG